VKYGAVGDACLEKCRSGRVLVSGGAHPPVELPLVEDRHAGNVPAVAAAAYGVWVRDDPVLRRPIGWWLGGLSSLANGPVSTGDLAAALRSFDDAASVAAVIDELVDRGWVQRGAEGLELTAEGGRVHDRLAAHVADVRSRVAGALPPEDYQRLVEMLARLTAAFEHPGAPA